ARVSRSLEAAGRAAPGPKDVVRDEKPSNADARHGQPKHFGVLEFVNVVKDQVELSPGLGEHSQRITDENANSVADAEAAEMFFGAARVCRVAVGVENFSLRSDGFRQP